MSVAQSCVLRLVDDDGKARAGELNRRRKAIRTGTDNNRIDRGHVFAITPVSHAR
jgi:hypothetical protein